MAKARDLAALAGLAGLAYAMRNKGESKTDTGDETDRLAARKPAPITDTGDETDRLLARSPTPDYSNEGRNKPLKVSPPVAPPKPTVAEDVIPTKPLATSTQRTDQLANLSRAVKREDKTKNYAKGEFEDLTRDAGDDSPTAIKAKKLYDTLDKKAGAPTSSAQKTDALAVASRAAAAADRQRKMAKQGAYKSGGMVSKVSSASSRADGIATKGKTRGKIC